MYMLLLLLLFVVVVVNVASAAPVVVVAVVVPLMDGLSICLNAAPAAFLSEHTSAVLLRDIHQKPTSYADNFFCVPRPETFRRSDIVNLNLLSSLLNSRYGFSCPISNRPSSL